MKNTKIKRNSRESGFSLVELLVALGVMTIVVGVTLNGINQAQKRNTAEAAKLDMTQQAREGMDQIVRDLHQAGYPTTSMYASGVSSSDAKVGAGITNLVTGSQSAVTFEGDVDGIQGVDGITYATIPVSGTACPCFIRRTAWLKVNPGATNSSTIIENVSQFKLTAYDITGAVTTDVTAIKRLDVELEVATQQSDMDTKKRAAASFFSTIRYNN